MNKNLLNVFYARLIVQLLIFISKLSPFVKIIMLFLTDFIDSELYRFYYKASNLRFDNDYQILDKINDSIGYLLSTILICQNKLLPVKNIKILMMTLFYRVIGEIVVYLKNDRRYYLVFIDIYKEMFLLMYFVNDFYVYLPFVIVVKLLQEYMMHYKPQETLDEKNK